MTINHPLRKVVVVHTVGKVASSTIYYGAKATLVNHQLFHTHTLNPVRMERIVRVLQRHGNSLSIESGHIKDSRDLAPILLDKSIEFKIITLIRDPIARDVSAFFENLNIFGVDQNNLPTVDEACKKFVATYPNNTIEEWFSDEFCKVFGIDLFAMDFPKDVGWNIFSKDNFKFLLMKAETPDDVKQNVVAAFLECPRFKISNANIMSEKFDKSYYKNFKVQLKHYIAEKLKSYDGDYVKYFYSDSEIDSMRQQWIF